MKTLVLWPVLLLSNAAMAESTTINCPDAYPTTLIGTMGVPAGWNGIAHVTGMKLALTAAGVIAGPPKSEVQGALQGKETKTKAGLRVEFAPLNKFTERQELWVYCAYGLGANVQLLHRVPDTTAMCVADYSRTPANGYDIRITCR
jgi:hypothetical protein